MKILKIVTFSGIPTLPPTGGKAKCRRWTIEGKSSTVQYVLVLYSGGQLGRSPQRIHKEIIWLQLFNNAYCLGFFRERHAWAYSSNARRLFISNLLFKNPWKESLTRLRWVLVDINEYVISRRWTSGSFYNSQLLLGSSAYCKNIASFCVNRETLL
jgi:hypothetical protein